MATISYCIISTVLLLVGVSSASTPQPTKSFEWWYSVEQPPRLPFDAVQSVVTFPPGGFVARHTHGGPLYAVMLQGTTTLWIDGEPAKTSYQGDAIVEPYRNISSAANPSATLQASLLATYLIPVGANLTTFEPGSVLGSPGPSSQFQSRMRLDAAPAESYKVHVYVLSYAPGAWAVAEVVAAPRLSTVVSGELFNGIQTFKAGEFWIERPGESSRVTGNVGDETAVVAVSIVPV
jgi:quercetin dioxygenase-like cupin family protein